MKKLLKNKWEGMRKRCNNLSNPNYGGRGITVCSEWGNSFESFYNWAIHSFKEGLTLDRINNNEGYSPDNCRFTDLRTQQNNRRLKANSGEPYIYWHVANKKYYVKVKVGKGNHIWGGYFTELSSAIIARNRVLRTSGISLPQ